MNRNLLATLTVCLLSLFFCVSFATSQQQKQSVRFVSSPDLFNFDVPNPYPQWDDAIDWYLSRVREENPDLFLVAGDLVLGEWEKPGPRAIEHLGLVYYGAWRKRMEKHGLRYAPAIGDHELGDDPWKNDKKRKLVPKFREVFLKYLDIPGERMPTDKKVAYFLGLGDR